MEEEKAMFSQVVPLLPHTGLYALFKAFPPLTFLYNKILYIWYWAIAEKIQMQGVGEGVKDILF